MGQSADFQRTLQAGDRPDIYVSTGSGNLRVVPSGGNTIQIVGHVHANGSRRDDVDDRVRRIAANPPIQQSGNQVRIGDPADRALYNGISIDYEIQAPRAAALNLRTGSGDAETQAVGRFIAVDTGSGTVRIHGVQGPAELRSGSGDIELQQNGEGGVRARTGSGSLRLSGLKGPLEAHTGSGDLEAAGRIEGPGEVSTGSGSVRLRFAPGDRLSIQASTGSGAIHANLPGFQVDSDSGHSAHGQVNGGGPLVNLRTGSGDIDLQQQ